MRVMSILYLPTVWLSTGWVVNWSVRWKHADPCLIKCGNADCLIRFRILYNFCFAITKCRPHLFLSFLCGVSILVNYYYSVRFLSKSVWLTSGVMVLNSCLHRTPRNVSVMKFRAFQRCKIDWLIFMCMWVLCFRLFLFIDSFIFQCNAIDLSV